jgi:hypothetical protein
MVHQNDDSQGQTPPSVRRSRRTSGGAATRQRIVGAAERWRDCIAASIERLLAPR